MIDNPNFDAIIIGGSYAGLSAALALGRSLREVLIIDSSRPCNYNTPHSHNLLTHDGRLPQEIIEVAKQQILTYKTVKFLNDTAVEVVVASNGIKVTTGNSAIFNSKKVILASGLKDVMPDIPGFDDCWGKSIIHCPYCHGYEFQNCKTAVIVNGTKTSHLVSLVNNLTKNITILTNGHKDLSDELLIKLQSKGIKCIETPIAEVYHNNGLLQSIAFNDGNNVNFDVAYAAVPFVQHSIIPKSLGCEFTEYGLIKLDTYQRTSIPNVYACGDNSNMMRSLANAIYSGNLTGAMVNNDLQQESW